MHRVLVVHARDMQAGDRRLALSQRWTIARARAAWGNWTITAAIMYGISVGQILVIAIKRLRGLDLKVWLSKTLED